VWTTFSSPVHTGPGARPASYTMGTGSFTGAKRTERSVDHQPPSSAEVKGTVELYLYSPSGPSLPVTEWFGGLVASMLASGSRVRGFKPGRSRWIFNEC
jgi:hypothetical protein